MSDDVRAEFNKYRDFVDSVYRRLVMIERDLKLAEDGWQIHFAIDFAELFAVAFPLGRSRYLAPLPGEDRSETYSRQLATLVYICTKVKDVVLSDAKNLILLPPYIGEMESTLSLIKENLINLDVLTGILEKVQTIAYSKNAYSPDVDAIVKKYKTIGLEPTEEERQVIIEYIKHQYPELISSIMLPTGSGIRILRNLIVHRFILPIKEYFTQFYTREQLQVLDIDNLMRKDVIEESVKRYASLFQRKRPGEDKYWPNRNDGMACALVSTINSKLVKLKGVLLIISHSIAMKSIAGSIQIDGDKEEKPYKIDVVRDLDYFWVYYAHKHDNRQEMLYRLKGVVDLMRRYHRTAQRLNRMKQPSDKVIKEAKDILAEVQTLVEEYDNVSLAAKMDDELMGLFSEYTKKIIRGDPRLVKRGIELLQLASTEEMTSGLIKERDQIGQRISELEETLQESAAKLKMQNSSHDEFNPNRGIVYDKGLSVE